MTPKNPNAYSRRVGNCVYTYELVGPTVTRTITCGGQPADVARFRATPGDLARFEAMLSPAGKAND